MKTFDEQIEEAAAAWADEDLLKIWIILQTPSTAGDSGQVMLTEDDIEEIGTAVLRLNKKFNAPEIKALLKANPA